MVSIEPADKGTAADGSVRLVYRDGSRECGQVVFRTEGPKAQLLQAAGENTLILDALVRAAQTTGLFGRREGDGLPGSHTISHAVRRWFRQKRQGNGDSNS